MKRGYLQMSFAWIFALIVGAFILFLAFFLVSRILETEQSVQTLSVSKDLGVILNPLETGLESAKVTLIELESDTRINNLCGEGGFGKQEIEVSKKSLGSWTSEEKVRFTNRYIFSDNPLEGKNFYVFSKPFVFPYKIADLILMIPKNKDYCFVDADKEINEEIRNLNLENVFNSSNIDDCPEESVRVCFDGGNCEIKVGDDYVLKDNERVYFYGSSLMFAGIFSDKEVYECQLKRLMFRMGELADIYERKAIFVSQKGCNTGINFLALKSFAENYEKSNDLSEFANSVEDAKRQNERGACGLW